MSHDSRNEHDSHSAYKTMGDFLVWYDKPAHHVRLINGMELQNEAIKFLKANNMEVDLYDFCAFMGIDLKMLEHAHDGEHH